MPSAPGGSFHSKSPCGERPAPPRPPAQQRGEPEQHQQQALVRAPQHERPRRAVPQSGQQHRHQRGRAVDPEVVPESEPPHPVQAPRQSVADRQEQVVAQPLGQADVPVGPELLRGPHEVREAEVDVQLDAEQLRRCRGRCPSSPRNRRRSGTRTRRSPTQIARPPGRVPRRTPGRPRAPGCRPRTSS